MKYLIAFLTIAWAFQSACAQNAPAQSGQSPIVPKPIATTPVKPTPANDAAKANQALRERYAALALAERLAIQSDLVWSGDFNGTVNGEFNDRAIAAVKAFQKKAKGQETGFLTAAERTALGAAAKSKRTQVDWRVVEDPVIAGLKLGVPSNITPRIANGKSGTHWTSARGDVQIETFQQTNATLAAAFEEQKKLANRRVTYSVIRPDFFVVSGKQATKNFYVRAQIKDKDIRGVTILYEQAMESAMQPVVIAMSSAFAPFGTGAAAAPVKRQVEYSTALFVSKAGHLIADRRATEECQFITIPGYGHAERLAENKAADVVLLRLNGARTPVPAALTDAPQADEISLVGIADPAAQSGARTVSNMAARIGNAGPLRTIEPAPAAGFSGAAVIDRQKHVIGIVVNKESANAGQPVLQPALVTTAELKKVLQAADITPVTSPPDDMRSAVAQVICVRK